ncbi:MAG: hypothetical protein Q9201_000670 [Fulgogasparrea decipioides]
MSVGRINELLSLSTDLQADVKEVAESLSLAVLRNILQDPRTPYVVLRLFDALSWTTFHGSNGDRKLVDIDQAVLAGEQYIRSKKSDIQGEYLVTLDDLSSILGPPGSNGTITFKRKSPPEGSFEFLDQKRESVVKLQGSDQAFQETFERVTHGVLKGLNWDHVLVIGGMVHSTLLHTDPLVDDAGDIAECDVDLYLYGLTPQEANCKIEEIYNVWLRNDRVRSHALGTTSDTMVFKNAKTITFIPKYPNRRIQVVLKLASSPLEHLLKVDLDACALGFDGSRVLMLPRCARALETGYSVFTMDLIWGHHLGSRRETQEVRLFEYADRGFGLRFLPSYIRSLEEHYDSEDSLSVEDRGNVAAKVGVGGRRSGPTRIVEGEPGLKTLRRIAYLGQDFVRKYFDSLKNGRFDDYRVEKVNGRPVIRLGAMDGHRMHEAFPDGGRGLGVFELLMRHCEAWRLDVTGKAWYESLRACESFLGLDRKQFSNTSYHETEDPYEDLPTYQWGPNLNSSFDVFERRVAVHNNDLWGLLRFAISDKLNIHHRHGSYVGYLTRRIRRLVAGRDLDAVREKQITMPLVVPLDLQRYITNDVQSRYEDLPENALSKLLLPVHDPSKYDSITATVPSLHDTASEIGNLRYRLVTNQSMWAGQHRALDEVAELLNSLFSWFMHREDFSLPVTDGHKFATDNDQCIWHLAASFRRRLILPKASTKLERGQSLPAREARLFRAWALTPLPRVERPYEEENEKMQEFQDEVARGGDIPDGLFWGEGNKGTWDEEGVPVWLD